MGEDILAPVLETEAETSAVDEADPYDHDAILLAWESGDPSALSEKNKQILDACIYVLDTTVTESMSDYDKELALHDWIVRWAGYDLETMSLP